MNIAPERARFLSAAAACLVLARVTSAELAQGFDPIPAPEAAGVGMPTNASSPDAAKPVAPVTELRPSGLSITPAISARPENTQLPAELIHQATFPAAGIVEKGSKSIQLIGIAATPVDEQCGSGPDVWPCGRVARAALQRFVRRRVVECRAPEGQPADGVAHCTVAGRDIGEWLVSQGWARAEGPRYAAAESAKRLGRQLCRGSGATCSRTAGEIAQRAIKLLMKPLLNGLPRSMWAVLARHL